MEKVTKINELVTEFIHLYFLNLGISRVSQNEVDKNGHENS